MSKRRADASVHYTNPRGFRFTSVGCVQREQFVVGSADNVIVTDNPVDCGLHADRKRSSGRKAGSCQRLLWRANSKSTREFSALGRGNQSLPWLRGSLGSGEAGRGTS